MLATCCLKFEGFKRFCFPALFSLRVTNLPSGGKHGELWEEFSRTRLLYYVMKWCLLQNCYIMKSGFVTRACTQPLIYILIFRH